MDTNLTFNGYYPDTTRQGSTAQKVVDLALQIRGFLGGIASSFVSGNYTRSRQDTTLKNLATKFVSGVFFLFVSPFLFLLFLSLVYLNRKLRRSTAKPFVLKTENYKQFRQQFDDLTKWVKWSDRFSLDLSKLNWYERVFAKQFQKMVATIKDRQQKMDAFFKDLDGVDDPLPNGWEIVTGQELWDNRPLPYEYLV